MQKVKAFVKLAPGVEANDSTKKLLLDHCGKHMPKTLAGKVACRVLEEEELSKVQTQE